MKSKSKTQLALDEHRALIGILSDQRIADICDCSNGSVKLYRYRHGIPSCLDKRNGHEKVWGAGDIPKNEQHCQIEGCINFHVSKFRGQYLCADHLNPDTICTVEDFVFANQSPTCCHETPVKVSKYRVRKRIRRTKAEMQESNSRFT